MIEELPINKKAQEDVIEFIKTLKRSEYSVVDQPIKLPAQFLYYLHWLPKKSIKMPWQEFLVSRMS